MLETLLDRFGSDWVVSLAGLLVGLLFGAAAQHSRFCLRAAVVEVADRIPGVRFAIWLVTFSTALVATQIAITLGYLDVSDARQLAATGSISGAVIGGLMFGCGMILARGCASRLLVLSATGNLRALLSGLVLTLVAQASLRGVLSVPRQYLGSLWTIEGGDSRNLLTYIHISPFAATVLTSLMLIPAAALIIHNKFPLSRSIAAIAVGLAIAFGWIATYQIALSSFDIVAVSSVSFTGPSTDTLMVLVNNPVSSLNFGTGLVVGVFCGSAFMAALTGEMKIQRFEADTPMERYLAGATLMGFGAMLAGGCAVGAGVTGSAIFALTAWIAIFFMWAGAISTHIVLQIWTGQAGNHANTAGIGMDAGQ